MQGAPGPGSLASERGLAALIHATTSSPAEDTLEKVNHGVSDDVKTWFKECADSFFHHLHHDWPLLHLPTFELESESLTITAPLLVLGSWCRDQHEPQTLRLDLHERLIKDRWDDWVCRTQSDHLGPNKAWAVETYQAILLSVIYEIYRVSSVCLASSSRTDTVLQNPGNSFRAHSLVSMLVMTLRAIGMFSSDTHEYQARTYFPSSFEPYLLANLERWKR